jgi:hypothetical protein
MAHVIKIEKLTLKQMIFDQSYHSLADDLINVPLPESFKICNKRFPIPQSVDEFSKNLCYAQRLFLPRKEDNDFGAIVRTIDGYYYPIVNCKMWDDEKALHFGKNVLSCKVIELYPVAMRLIQYTSDLLENEYRLLHREPTKQEIAAGVDKLNIFSELYSLNFLRDDMKISTQEVLLTPYNEILVRFMMHKETEDFRKRYEDLLRMEAEAKSKKGIKK